MTKDSFFELVLSFPAVIQTAHFERTGFKVDGKRMFATYLDANNTVNVFLSVEEQAAFCELDPDNIFPVPNKWGEKGATTFKLNTVSQEIIAESLYTAYQSTLSPKKKQFNSYH